MQHFDVLVRISGRRAMKTGSEEYSQLIVGKFRHFWRGERLEVLFVLPSFDKIILRPISAALFQDCQRSLYPLLSTCPRCRHSQRRCSGEEIRRQNDNRYLVIPACVLIKVITRIRAGIHKALENVSRFFVTVFLPVGAHVNTETAEQ